MFGVSLPELLFIGVIALLLIGPKDIPVAVRTLVRAARKMQGVKRKLQSHIDDLVREADIASISSAVADVKAMPVRRNGTDGRDRENDLDGSSAKPGITHSITSMPYRSVTFV